MRVEYFQKFHVGSDQCDQIAFVPALEFSRAESAQCAKDPVANERKQRKSNIVVESLLDKAQDRP